MKKATIVAHGSFGFSAIARIKLFVALLFELVQCQLW
jgi:hypothetical protein